MDVGELAVLIMVLAPIVGGSACICTPKRWTNVYTLISVGVTGASSIALLIYMSYNGISSITINIPGVSLGGVAVLISSFILLGTVVYLGARVRSPFIIAFGAIDVVITIYLSEVTSWAGSGPALVIDYLSVLLALITSLIGAVICIYALRYMRDDAHKASFFALMLFFIGTMNGAVFSNDLLWMFLFWMRQPYALIY